MLQGQNDTWQKRKRPRRSFENLRTGQKPFFQRQKSTTTPTTPMEFLETGRMIPNELFFFLERAQWTVKSQGCWKSGMAMVQKYSCVHPGHWRVLFCCPQLIGQTPIPFYMADLLDVCVSVELCSSIICDAFAEAWAIVGACDKPSNIYYWVIRPLSNLDHFLVFGGWTCTIHEWFGPTYGKSC